MNDQNRIVVAIPHYYGVSAVGTRRYGSTRDSRTRRAAILRRTVLGLHQAFGTAQCIMQLDRKATAAANQSFRKRLRVLICTSAENHLLADAGLPAGSFEQVESYDAAIELGYTCHQVLAECAHQAEWFGYLEDDLLVHDPTWFQKLAWFLTLAGTDAVLMPHRFERGDALLASKAYVDGDLAERVTQPFQDRRLNPEVSGVCWGAPVRFVRPRNPHSGCFFLCREQLDLWMRHSEFGDRSRAFIGPLESAATLSIMRCFRVYKAAVEQAGFFEIEHQSNQFIGQLRKKSE